MERQHWLDVIFVNVSIYSFIFLERLIALDCKVIIDISYINVFVSFSNIRLIDIDSNNLIARFNLSLNLFFYRRTEVFFLSEIEQK